MKYYSISIILLSIILLSIILLFLPSCAWHNNSTLKSWVKPQVNLLTLNEIAILPFSTNSSSQGISAQDLLAVNKKLMHELKLKTTLSITDCEVTKNSNSTLLQQAIEHGKVCNSQAVLYGIISKYGEGKSAAFTLWLYSIRHKAVVWTASYENSQPVLTDNLLGLGGQSFKYSSSEENLFSGFRQVSQELESKRILKN